MEQTLEKLDSMIQESNNIVFLGGAGVSTESGIPDFRSVDGLYNQKYDYPPETILSHTFYRRKQMSSIAFIVIRCFVWMQNQMRTFETCTMGAAGKVESRHYTKY